MQSLIQDRLVLILQVSFDITPKTIYKGVKVTKIFSKEMFELRPNNKTNRLMFYFVLDLLLTYYSSEKQGRKGDWVWPCCFNHIKVVFTLFTKLIILYKQVTWINLWKMGFKKLLLRINVLWKLGLILLALEKQF